MKILEKLPFNIPPFPTTNGGPAVKWLEKPAAEPKIPDSNPG